MATRRVTLLDSGGRTVSDYGPVVRFDDEFHTGQFVLKVTAKSGTLPTLEAFVQTELPDGSFSDLASFAQMVDVGSRVAVVAFPTPQSFTEGAVVDRALSRGTVRNLLVGPTFRVGWLIGGVGAGFTFEVHADLQGSQPEPDSDG